MKQSFSQLTSAIPIFALLCYALGYTYFKTFYSEFDIRIEYYISLTDLVFVSVEYLFWVILVIVVYQVLADGFFSYVFLPFLSHFVINLSRENKKPRRVILRGIDIFSKGKLYQDYSAAFLALFCIAGLGGIIFQPYSSRIFYFFFPSFLILNYFQEMVDQTEEFMKKLPVRLSVFTLISLGAMYVLGIKDSNSVKKGESKKNLEILVGDSNFSTGSSGISYIGETSSYIFLFDSNGKKSITLNKSEIQIINAVLE